MVFDEQVMILNERLSFEIKLSHSQSLSFRAIFPTSTYNKADLGCQTASGIKIVMIGWIRPANRSHS
jgi:hypothetical protein